LGTASGGTWETGDFSGDGRVSVADLMLLRANLSTGSSLPTSIPEPGSLALIAAGASAAYVVRRRRR
jgi:hypothetical protein